jgi:hypothetical protein
MSMYHIHTVVVYLSLLGVPMFIASTKVTGFSIRHQLLQALSTIPSFGFLIYACATQKEKYSQLGTCEGINEVSLLKKIWALAIAIDVFAFLFAVPVLMNMRHWIFKSVDKLIDILEHAAIPQSTSDDELDQIKEGLPLYIFLCFILLPLNEAFRALYGKILDQESAENSWTFGQTFAITMLLEPLGEYVLNRVRKGMPRPFVGTDHSFGLATELICSDSGRSRTVGRGYRCAYR